MSLPFALESQSSVLHKAICRAVMKESGGERQEAERGAGIGGGGAERSHNHTGKRGSYYAVMATGENPTHESVGK